MLVSREHLPQWLLVGTIGMTVGLIQARRAEASMGTALAAEKEARHEATEAYVRFSLGLANNAAQHGYEPSAN